MPDGSVIVVELSGGRVDRVQPDGTKTTVADARRSPERRRDRTRRCAVHLQQRRLGVRRDHRADDPRHRAPDRPQRRSHRAHRPRHRRGRRCSTPSATATRSSGPNDIVFDAHGGMWFTDHGRRQGRVQHVGAIYYAQPDGSSIREVVFPSESPNGIGLSPDGYAAVRGRDAHRTRVRVERHRRRARSSGNAGRRRRAR